MDDSTCWLSNSVPHLLLMQLEVWGSLHAGTTTSWNIAVHCWMKWTNMNTSPNQEAQNKLHDSEEDNF